MWDEKKKIEKIFTTQIIISKIIVLSLITSSPQRNFTVEMLFNWLHRLLDIVE